jgi:hypothetical protein
MCTDYLPALTGTPKAQVSAVTVCIAAVLSMSAGSITVGDSKKGI